RARVGRLRHARDLEHDAAPGEGVRERRYLPGALLPERRDVRGVVRGQEGQVSEPAGADPAASVARSLRWHEPNRRAACATSCPTTCGGAPTSSPSSPACT